MILDNAPDPAHASHHERRRGNRPGQSVDGRQIAFHDMH